MADLMYLAQRYVKLHAEHQRLKAELDAVKEKAGAIEGALKEEFVRSGVQNVTLEVAGQKWTPYLHRQLWASLNKADKETALSALSAAGLGDLIKPQVNSSALSAWVRELPQDGEGMPVLETELRDAINVTDKVSIRVRKA